MCVDVKPWSGDKLMGVVTRSPWVYVLSHLMDQNVALTVNVVPPW